MFFKTKFGDMLTTLGGSRRFQPAIHTGVHEESESEVQNIQIPQENSKFRFRLFKQKKRDPISGLFLLHSSKKTFKSFARLFKGREASPERPEIACEPPGLSPN